MTGTSAGVLDGKRVVVAGASVGIGRAVALRCATEGASVVVGARGADALADTVAAIEATGARAAAVAGSVADPEVAAHLVATAVDQLGGLDVLVNCAGIAEPPGSSILDITIDDWRQQLDVHLTGTFNTCQHAARVMVAQGGGAIVNTSSHAFLGSFGGTGYPAAKGGTNSLTYALAAELAEHGVRVNAVCPGGRTRLSTGEGFEAHIDRLHERGMLDDLLRDASLTPAPPEDVASLYAFLASDAAAGITGEVLWGAGPFAGRFPKPDATFDLVWDGDGPPTVAALAAALAPDVAPAADSTR